MGICRVISTCVSWRLGTATVTIALTKPWRKLLTCHYVPNETSLGVPPIAENIGVTQIIRALKGRNNPCLVWADNGQHYVQKVLNRDQLFNEGLGSQLGFALGLSFPAWAELQTDASAVHDRRPSTFGSELIHG